MKNFLSTVRQKSLLPECWLYEEKNYFLEGTKRSSLPYVPKEYEAILKCLKIPYRRVEEVLEFWNPSFYEEEALTLPVYVKLFDEYRYTGKNYTGWLPSIETVEEAQKISAIVNHEIYKYDEIIEEVENYQSIKRILNGEICKVTTDVIIPDGGYVDIEVNKDHYRIYGYRIFSVIFDLNKINSNSHLKLYAPNDIAGAVIGKGGKNVVFWTNHLNVSRIQVIPYK